MQRSTAADDQTLMGRLFDWVKARTHRDDNLYALSLGDLTTMAADLGITEADLRDILPRTSDHSLLMDEMMTARGLDPDRVRRLSGALMRDLELTCSRCGTAARCRSELAVGVADANCHEYCGNAETFDALLAEA